MQTYGQFCPIARASELFAQRWTPVILRNLLIGCSTFNEIRQGAPGISTALLAQRLDSLERHGLVASEPAPTGRGRRYRLTEMGRDIKPVCDTLGRWGARWMEIQPHHLDPAYVLWATTKLIDVERLPVKTIVVRFDLRERPGEHYWLILRRPMPELCTRGVGYTEDLVARTDAACLVDLHLTRTNYPEAIRCGRLVLDGPPALAREFPHWIRPSPFAAHIPDSEAHLAATGSSAQPHA